jgi:8-oxo-dGTP diphosphatase
MRGLLIQAGGGALWRPGPAGPEIAVVHRPRYDDWSLPKGKAKRGEHPLATACREVREETGVRPVAGPRLPGQRYVSPDGPKVVRFWAMRAGAGAFRATREVDSIRWLPVSQARPLLTYRRDRRVLDALAPAVPVDAVLLLVRRADTDGPALALRDLLPAFAPDRLACAPDPRSRRTLAPLAGRLGLTVGAEPVPPVPAGTTVLCTGGGAVRDLLAGYGVPSRARAGKGSAWALFFRAGHLVTADYYPA